MFIGILFLAYYTTLQGTHHMHGVTISEIHSISTTCSIISNGIKMWRGILMHFRLLSVLWNQCQVPVEISERALADVATMDETSLIWGWHTFCFLDLFEVSFPVCICDETTSCSSGHWNKLTQKQLCWWWGWTASWPWVSCQFLQKRKPAT